MKGGLQHSRINYIHASTIAQERNPKRRVHLAHRRRRGAHTVSCQSVGRFSLSKVHEADVSA